MHEFSPFYNWSATSPYAFALALTAVLCLVLLIIYSYCLLAAGDFLLLRNAFSRASPYRGGVAVTLVASLVPWGGNSVSMERVPPAPR